MPIGTGLPIPQGGDQPIQPPGIASGGDFGASSYARMAQAAEKIEKAGLQTAELARAEREKEADRLRMGQLSDQENQTRREVSDLHVQQLTQDGGPNPQQALETGQKQLAKRLETISDPKLQEAVKKDYESRLTGVYTSLNERNAATTIRNAHEATDQNITGLQHEYNTLIIQDKMFDKDGNYTQEGAAKAQKLDYYTKRAVDNGQHPEAWRQNILDNVAGSAAGVTIGRKVFEAALNGTITEEQVQDEIRRNTVDNKSLNDSMKSTAFTKANDYFQQGWAARKKEITETRREATEMRTLYKDGNEISMNDHVELVDRLTRLKDVKSVVELNNARAKALAIAAVQSGGPAAVQQQLAVEGAKLQGVGENLVNTFKESEGFTGTAKWDYKQYSVGYGTRGSPGQTISREQADVELRKELGQDAAWLNQTFPGLKQNNPGAWDALLSLSHNSDRSWANKGLGGLVRESMQTGDWTNTAGRFREYNKAGGAFIPGLQNRRNREVQWFFNGGPDAGAPTAGAPTPLRGSLPAGPFPEGEPPGLITAGNINLYDRPIVDVPGAAGQPPGKATVRSITIEQDGKHYVLPTVVQTADNEAKVVSNEEAVQHFKQTGEHLGSFKTAADAVRYAKRLHEAQAEFYITGPQPRMAVPAATGAAEAPTIDLSRRRGPVDAIVITDEGKNVVIPTTADDGTKLSGDEALKQYKESGDHYGKFDKLADANNFQQALRAAPGLAPTNRPVPTTTGGGGGTRAATAGPPLPPGPGGRVPAAEPAPAPTQTPSTPPSLGGVPAPPSPTIGADTAQPVTPVGMARAYERAAWQEQEKWLKENWTRLEPTVKQGKFSELDAGAMFNIVDSPYVKDQVFAQKVKAAMAGGSFAAAIKDIPVGQRQAAMDAWEANMRANNAPPDLVKDIMDTVKTNNTNLMNLARTDPQRYRLDQGASPAIPFNFDNLDQSLKAINDRRMIAQTVASENHMPVGNMLSAADQNELAYAITNGSQQQVEVASRTLAQMTSQEARAALGGEHNPLKSALIGAQGSVEPFRFDSVNGTLDKWAKGDELNYSNTMSKDSEVKLDAWRMNKTIYSPAEQIKLNERLKDPAYRKIVDEATSGGGDIAKDWAKLKPDDLVRAINPTFANKFIAPVIGAATQGRPVAEMSYPFGNPFTQRLFESQMKTAYTNLRAQGVSHDMALTQAAQVLERTWGVSEANNGTLMQFPPEKTLKRPGEDSAAVGGSMEWANQQLDDAVDKHYKQAPNIWIPSGMRRGFLGQRQNVIPFAASTTTTPIYSFSNLVADERTERDISTNAPDRPLNPSYGIIVTTPDGRKEVMTDINGDQVRFRFDRQAAIDEYNKSTARVRHEAHVEAIRQSIETFKQGGGAVVAP